MLAELNSDQWKPMPTKSDRIEGLDGLRFIAAMSVLLGHAVQFLMLRQRIEMTTPVWFIAHLNNFGMTSFFVLSGFVIYVNYHAVVQQKGGLRQFFFARWSRLYPLFFVVFVWGLYYNWKYNELSQDFIPHIFRYLTFTESWFYWPQDHALSIMNSRDRVVAVMWSLSTEWLFYCAYPLFAGRLSKLRGRAAGVLIAVAGIISLMICVPLSLYGATIGEWLGVANPQEFSQWLWYYSPWIRLPEFVIGALAAQIYLTGFRFGRTSADLCAAACLSAVALMFTLMFATSSPIGGVDTTILAPCFAVLCLAATTKTSLYARLLSMRLMVSGGEASYSLYLLHPWLFHMSEITGVFPRMAPLFWLC